MIYSQQPQGTNEFKLNLNLNYKSNVLCKGFGLHTCVWITRYEDEFCTYNIFIRSGAIYSEPLPYEYLAKLN